MSDAARVSEQPDQVESPIWYSQEEATEATTSGMEASPTPPARNDYGQPIGAPVADWTERSRPGRTPMEGRLCRLEPLQADRHADALYERYSAAPDARDWTYLPYGPVATRSAFRELATSVQDAGDPAFFVIDAGEGPVGVAAFMRINSEHGSIEVGHVHYSRALQGHPAGTEAMYLMMRRAFDELGYRRYEWKCHALNARSVSAARRLGFTYEGTFRQASVVKGRNRDTAWFSLLDHEWPGARARFEAWLSPDNFDAAGKQRRRLQDC